MLDHRVDPARPGFWETPLTPELISRAQRVEMPRLSPDGEWLAYVRSFDGRSDLWVTGMRDREPRRISEEMPCRAGQDSAPFAGGYGVGVCWTPDSTAVIYTGAPDRQLYRLSRKGGAPTRLTNDPGNHLNPRVGGGGAYVVCVVDRGDVDGQIFIGRYEAGDESPRRLTPEGVVALDPVPSPDGTKVACVLYRGDDRWAHHSQIAVVDLASGEVSHLTATENVNNLHPRWSPDGRELAFLSDRSGWLNVWTIPAAGGEAKPVAPEPAEQPDFVWSPSGSQIAYLRNEAAEISVMLYENESGRSRKISDARGVHRELSWSGNWLAALHHSASSPPSVIAFDVERRSSRPVVSSTVDDASAPFPFVEPEHISWQSSDGMTVYGLLYTPRSETPQRYPLLVHVHGGPTTQSLVGWDPVVQYFVLRGWAVLQPNYRGSTGYGRAYADGLHGVWGWRDLEDNACGVGAVKERGVLDEDRVVIWGGSAGGYATLASVTMLPGVYMAGVDLYGIADWTTMPETADRYIRHLADSELGPRETHWNLWVERSPIAHVERVTEPLLILQGTADRRVPKPQSDAMVAALRAAGKMVDYHVYEGEGHGWSRSATIIDYVTRMEAFLAERVLGPV